MNFCTRPPIFLYLSTVTELPRGKRAMHIGGGGEGVGGGSDWRASEAGALTSPP